MQIKPRATTLDATAQQCLTSGNLAFVGLAIAAPDGARSYATAGMSGLVADETCPFRVASVSKPVVARTLAAVWAQAHIGDPARARLHDVLPEICQHGWGRDVTLGMLASHTSGLWDAAGYIVPAGETVMEWFPKEAIAHEKAGTYFRYANINFLILAAVIERLGNDRFDRLAQRRVLGPLGLSAGFNWSGVGSAHRAKALATYRRDGATFHP